MASEELELEHRMILDGGTSSKDIKTLRDEQKFLWKQKDLSSLKKQNALS